MKGNTYSKIDLNQLERGVYFILEKNQDEVLRIIKVYIEK